MKCPDYKTSLCYYHNFGQMITLRDPKMIELLKAYPDMMRWGGLK